MKSMGFEEVVADAGSIFRKNVAEGNGMELCNYIEQKLFSFRQSNPSRL